MENYFVADKKKTISLNEKNLDAKQTPPFQISKDFEPLDVFPPLKHRPEPPLPFDVPQAGPDEASRRMGYLFRADEVVEMAKRDPPDSLNGMIMNMADKAYNFLTFSYKIFDWLFA